jgi:hypothetical protein
VAGGSVEHEQTDRDRTQQDSAVHRQPRNRHTQPHYPACLSYCGRGLRSESRSGSERVCSRHTPSGVVPRDGRGSQAPVSALRESASLVWPPAVRVTPGGGRREVLLPQGGWAVVAKNGAGVWRVLCPNHCKPF